MLTQSIAQSWNQPQNTKELGRTLTFEIEIFTLWEIHCSAIKRRKIPSNQADDQWSFPQIKISHRLNVFVRVRRRFKSTKPQNYDNNKFLFTNLNAMNFQMIFAQLCSGDAVKKKRKIFNRFQSKFTTRYPIWRYNLRLCSHKCCDYLDRLMKKNGPPSLGVPHTALARDGVFDVRCLQFT